MRHLTRRTSIVRRAAAWWRWIVRPWRSIGLISALIGSFAVPAFMAASADVFVVTASDAITRQVLDDDPTGLGTTVFASGRLAPEGVDELDGSVRDQLRQVRSLGEPDRTLYVVDPSLGLQRPPAEEGAAAQPIIGSGAKFVARDGAIAALDVVAGDRSTDGVWISERMSERVGLSAGSMVTVNDSDPVPIAGVYANLWEGDLNPYWDDVPAEFVPTFSKVFNGPVFEVIIVPETVLYGFDLVGNVRWDTVVTDRPDTYAALVSQTIRTRNVERSYTESDRMVAAIATFSGPGGSVPTVRTDIFDLRRDIDALRAELDQPISTAATGGIALGLIVTAAGAAFAVRKHASEVRLLRADGDAAWRFAGRALVQYVAPAAVGGLAGVGAALLVGGLPGESARASTSVIGTGAIVLTVLIGLVVAAAVTAGASMRMLYTGRSAVGALRLGWILPIAGLAVAAWIQVGSAGAPGEVDTLVIGFPFVGLLAGVGLSILVARTLMHRLHRTGRSLPPPLFLAWRRITSADSGAVLLAVAMGIALGLVVFSTGLITSLDRATEAKAITAVGGNTQVVLDGRFEGPLPERTTLIHLQTTRLTIGERPVSIVVVDPDTYADAVSWDRSFGSSAASIVESLHTPVDADVPVVIAGSLRAPLDGGFGTTNVLSYRVVDTIDAAPLTSEVYPTMIVSSEQFIAAARLDHEAQRPADADPEEWAATFRSPLDRYRRVIVSQLDATRLEQFLTDNGAAIREVTTQADRRDLVGNRAARWTFGYLGLLAAIAGLAAIGALLFYLSEQRASRQLSTVMARRMGLRPASASVAAVGEVLGLVVIAFAAGTVTGLLIANRVFDRFEPDPRLAPDVGLDVPWGLITSIGAVATVIVVVAALVNQWAASRDSYAEVLRGT